MRFVFKTSYGQDLGLFRDAVQRNWYVALLLGTLVLPLVVRDYLVDISLVFVYGLCGLALMVLAGYTGLVSLGHAAFLGIGAYAHVYFAQDLGLPWVVSVALAAVLTSAAGMIVGLPALRMTGVYLTIATLAFALIIQEIFNQWEKVTGGLKGKPVDKPVLFGVSFAKLTGTAMAQRELRGVTKSEIVLGMHTDLSGPAATYGVSSSNAVKMRFDEVNEKGGIHGRKIKLIVEDTQYQVPRAVQAGTKLINRDKIFAMVAPLGTPMNNALFKDQFDAGVPNLFPLSAARSMYEPFHKLKFYGAASYVDQVRAGINYFVTKKNKKALCAMYQDTDFGKEVLDGVTQQAEKMKLKVVETVTHKPTDQDFTAQITKLKAAGCDLVVLGTIVRDSIVPYATARKIGWTDVDFLGSAATYDMFVAAAQGGVTEGLYAMGLTDMPYRDTLSPAAAAWFDRYKERFKNDPNIGAVYGHVAADLTVVGLEKAGSDLTLDALIKGLESIKGYRDIFNGPEANFGPNKHQGASSSFLAVVKGGRWTRLTDPLGFYN